MKKEGKKKVFFTIVFSLFSLGLFSLCLLGLFSLCEKRPRRQSEKRLKRLKTGLKRKSVLLWMFFTLSKTKTK